MYKNADILHLNRDKIKYESAITSLLEDDPTANQAEFCVHIRS